MQHKKYSDYIISIRPSTRQHFIYFLILQIYCHLSYIHIIRIDIADYNTFTQRLPGLHAPGRASPECASGRARGANGRGCSQLPAFVLAWCNCSLR